MATLGYIAETCRRCLVNRVDAVLRDKLGNYVGSFCSQCGEDMKTKLTLEESYPNYKPTEYVRAA